MKISIKWKEKLGKYPIPSWLLALVAVAYCESLLHLWTMEEFSAGRFAAVVGFALGFGGLLGQILSFIGHKTWGKWVSTGVMALVTVFYIVEYFVNDAYMTFMPMGTLLGGAKGVATDFADVVVTLVLRDFWRILVFLLPVIAYALLAAPCETGWRTRWILLVGVIATYGLSFGIVTGVGTDTERLSTAYNFDSAIRCFGLNMGMALDTFQVSDGEESQGAFGVTDTPAQPELQAPAQ